MDLTSMKISKEEAKEMVSPGLAEKDVPQYPYGLQLNLDGDALKKLGLKDLPTVGQKLLLFARVEVTSVSQHESKGGYDHKGCGLQITDMCVEQELKKKSATEVLYPS